MDHNTWSRLQRIRFWFTNQNYLCLDSESSYLSTSRHSSEQQSSISCELTDFVWIHSLPPIPIIMQLGIHWSFGSPKSGVQCPKRVSSYYWDTQSSRLLTFTGGSARSTRKRPLSKLFRMDCWSSWSAPTQVADRKLQPRHTSHDGVRTLVGKCSSYKRGARNTYQRILFYSPKCLSFWGGSYCLFWPLELTLRLVRLSLLASLTAPGEDYFFTFMTLH